MLDKDIFRIIDFSIKIEPNLVQRFKKCEIYYKQYHEKEIYLSNLLNAKVCFFDEDVCAWYLYQLTLYTNNTQDCDFNLNARIVPIFKTIGENIDKLLGIRGFEKKFKLILNSHDITVDHLLCEVLVALSYRLNVSNCIEFIQETNTKTPDILVVKNNKYFNVEVKKKFKNSEYFSTERIQWSRLSFPVTEYLKNNRINFCYRITFHKELHSYPDDYLINIITYLNKKTKGLVYSDESITIIQEEVNLDTVHDYLKNYDLRIDTTQLTHMLFGYNFEKDNAITYEIEGQRKNHYFYYNDILSAHGLIWNCDSAEAIKNHAKSLKKLLVKAVNQIPDKTSGSIHFIMESYQGSIVDEQVFFKLKNEIDDFNFLGKYIQYIYLHTLKFRIPPDQNWLVDQDCVFWQRSNADLAFKLNNPLLLDIR